MEQGAGSLLLRHARVWARPGEPVSEPQDLLIRGERIAAIGDVSVAEDDIRELDLGGRVVTAGFWNCHVHLTERVWSLRSADALTEIQATIDDMMLSRGFVGVVDLGSRPRTTNALVRRIDSGELRGPTIVTAGIGIRPWRGTQFYIKDIVPWYLRWALPMPITGGGARRTVSSELRSGARVVKLFTGSYVTPQRVKPMRPGIAHAATEAAHRRGARVFAHPSNREGTAIAIAAGVDALAHVPDETEGTAPLLEEAARRGTRIVPTLHMFASTVRADDGYLLPIYAALRGFIEAGGRVLFGTDVGYMPDRDTRPEFEAMAASGMAVEDILHALTAEPASFFGHDDAGAIEVGNVADLTVLDAATVDLKPTDLSRVHAVMRRGDVIWAAPPVAGE